MNQVIKIATATTQALPARGNPHYPRWTHCADGAMRIVEDHHQHSALTGLTYGPDAQLVSAHDWPKADYEPPGAEGELAEDCGALETDPAEIEPSEPAPAVIHTQPVIRRRGPNKLQALVRQRLAERSPKTMAAAAVVEPAQDRSDSEVC